MSNHTNIAIIGGSFAGLSALLAARKRLGEKTTIKLFEQRQHFTYIPALHETLMTSPEALKSIQIDLKKYYPNEYIQQQVTELNKGSLTTVDGTVWTYDYLVIATGSRTNFFDNEQRKQEAYTVRYDDDIAPLNKALSMAKNITVIGGGYTGIEVASVIAERKTPQQQLRVIHSRDRLFNRLSKAISVWTENRLRKRGVSVILEERVDKIQSGSITLASGKTLQSDVTIASRGIRTNDELHAPVFTFQGGYRADESDTVYICGDVATHGLYTTAHNAMIEGRRVGYRIADHIQGKKKQYTPLRNRDKLAIALGSRDGILTNGTKGTYIPKLIGLAKKIVERRILFEFRYKIMLRV